MERPDQPQRHEERKEKPEESFLFALFVSLRFKNTSLKMCAAGEDFKP